jgi:putative aminopeptidase FrvX
MAVLYRPNDEGQGQSAYWSNSCVQSDTPASSLLPNRDQDTMRVSYVAALLVTPLSAQAQSTDSVAIKAAAEWIRLVAPPGTEHDVAVSLAKSLGDGWQVDRFGNLVKRLGSGMPRRVVACGLDFPAYVVSQITSGGYLRVRRTGTAGHPLWDQFHEAQRVAVMARNGRLPGVVAVANGHFAQQHRADTLAATMDDLWIDIGASSAAEAARAGVALLDPLTIERPAWTFADVAAGPAAGARAGCAAVVAASTGQVSSGETFFVVSSQRSYNWLGLNRLLSSLGRVQALAFVGDGVDASAAATGGRGGRGGGRGGGIPARATFADAVHAIIPRVRYARSMVESIASSELREIASRVMSAAGVSRAESWPTPGLDTARTLSRRAGTEGEIERQWMAITDLPGVAGHEHLVRAAVLAALPTWARSRAVVDSMGNVIVAMGPERDSVAFIAHMDEVGFEVASVLSDGRVALRTRGGAVIPSWEGTPAMLHFETVGNATASPALRGVFVPRDSGRTRSPGTLTAWFGLDSSTLVARGVREGLSVTSYKRADRLLGSRITGRASDDRTGTTAMLFAIRRINPDSLTHKVIFVWSVQEEGGLNGARFFGDRHGVNLRRVYSIDTFVSSDTPKESPHFAFAPLGSGMVLRGLDNASQVPRAERDRILALARARSIPIQLGTTFGSTDGSAIQPWGPVNIGLSWPGRYSHGPAEVLDLRDVDALIRLIVALATDRGGAGARQPD